MNKKAIIITAVFIGLIVIGILANRMSIQFDVDKMDVYDYLTAEAVTGTRGELIQAKFKDIDPNNFNPDVFLPNGETLVTKSIRLDNTSFLQKLSDMGADLSKVDKHGNDAILLAIKNNNIDLADRILRNEVKLDKELMFEVSKSFSLDNEELLVWYLQNNLKYARIQELGSYFKEVSREVKAMMITSGYKPEKDMVDNLKEEILESENVSALLELYKNNTERYTVTDSYKILELFVERGVNDSASEDLLRLLLKKGVDPHADYKKEFDYNNQWYESYVSQAIDYNRYNFLKVCFEEGVKLDKNMEKNKKQAYIQRGDGFQETFTLLVENGLPLDDEYFYTAVEQHVNAVVQIYIDNGIDIHKKRYDKSALDIALNREEFKSLETAKILLDAGAGDTEERKNKFYQNLQKNNSIYKKYYAFDNILLKVSVDKLDNIYVASLKNSEKELSIIKYDKSLKELWAYSFRGKKYINVINNLAGLYIFDSHVLSVENILMDGVQKSVLTLISSDGKKLLENSFNGEFKSLVIKDRELSLVTKKEQVILNEKLQIINDGIFVAVHSLEDVEKLTRSKSYFTSENTYKKELIKSDFVDGKTLVLYQSTEGIRNPGYSNDKNLNPSYIAVVMDGGVSKLSKLGGENTTVLDFAQSSTKSYLLQIDNGQSVLVSRSLDFEDEKKEYLKIDDNPFNVKVQDISCDESGCSLSGVSSNSAFVARFDENGKADGVKKYTKENLTELDVKEKWTVARSGNRDLVNGWSQSINENSETIIEKDNFHFIDKPRDMNGLMNGGFVVVGEYNQLPGIELLDRDGKIRKHKTFQFEFLDGHINTVKELENGNILVVGHLYEDYNYWKTFSALLDADANPIWSRIYDDFNSMRDIELEKDGFLSVVSSSQVVKLSYDDGEVLKTYNVGKGLEQIAISSDGRMVGMGVLERGEKKDKTRVPLLYCLNNERTRVQTVLSGGNKDKISTISSLRDKIFVSYEYGTDGSVHGNTIFAEVDENCQIGQVK